MAETPEGGVPKRTRSATLDDARRPYEANDLNQAEIARRLGLHAPSISRKAKREGWRRPASISERRAVAASIRAQVDREMAAVDKLFGEAGRRVAADRARTLASLVRTLRELAKLDEDRVRAVADSAGKRSGAEEPDAAVTDIDGLRRTLAERLDRLRREREAD